MVGGNQVRPRHAAAAAVALSGVLLAAFAVTLAMPVETWRSGERFEAELPSIPPEAMPSPAERIWIDADAGCGAGPWVDADDCLAILYLARRGGLEIAGLSTVFGNAPLEVTDRKARELEVEARHLDQMRSAGVAGRWVAERARSWLEYWESDIGRSGFFPFDLVAAAFVVEPRRFRCAEVAVELGRDDAVHFPFSRMPALLVEARHGAGAPAGPPAHLYCHAMGERRHRLLHELGRAPTR